MPHTFNRTTTISANGILVDATDYHSHILPGVDDGVESIDETLLILDKYEQLGVKSLWLTPHVMEDIPNTPTALQERFAELKETYKGNIELHLAAEYMIDNHLQKILKEEKLLPIGHRGDHLLVETSYFSSPIRLHETIGQIKSLGYFPLLAHPERYMYMESGDYLELKEKDVKFQLNILSLGGYYGNTAKKKALWMLKNGLYDVAGSDLHNKEAIMYIKECRVERKMANKIGEVLKNNL